MRRGMVRRCEVPTTCTRPPVRIVRPQHSRLFDAGGVNRWLSRFLLVCAHYYSPTTTTSATSTDIRSQSPSQLPRCFLETAFYRTHFLKNFFLSLVKFPDRSGDGVVEGSVTFVVLPRIEIARSDGGIWVGEFFFFYYLLLFWSEMVMESWFSSLWRSSGKNASEPEKVLIGVLAFEVTSLMSKVVHLWQCLSDREVLRLREEIMNSIGVRKLVSDDDDFLVGLVFEEMVHSLNFVVRSVARLGKKCTDPSLQRFEHVFDDLIKNDDDLYSWEFNWKKMERKVKKMERFIATNSNLYQELEVLAELEQTLRRMQGSNDPNHVSLLKFQQKVVWQRHTVKNLRESSLWNRTYDYTIRLLGRSLFTIFRRIKHVFGINETEAVNGVNDSQVMNTDYLSRSHSISALMQSSVHPSESNRARFSSGPLERSSTKSGPIPCTSKTINKQWHTHEHLSTLCRKNPRLKTKRLAPLGPFKGCMMGVNDSPVLQSYTTVSSGCPRSNVIYSGFLNGVKDSEAEQLAQGNRLHANLPMFSSKRRLLNAAPSTLGAAALALHYANVVIVIEKLVASPHLIGPDARDDLYNMLPTSVKAALRARLKSFSKNLDSSFCDAVLAAEWSEAMTKILEWLAPLAHNMIRWQSERTFEQQHLVSRTNVLLVQTFHFANQAKVEGAITELLVGLNYIWRFGRDLNAKALLECTGSGILDFDMKG